MHKINEWVFGQLTFFIKDERKNVEINETGKEKNTGVNSDAFGPRRKKSNAAALKMYTFTFWKMCKTARYNVLF